MKRIYDWIKEHSAVIGVVIAFLALLFVAVPGFTWYQDSDGDGYGNPSQNIWRPWQPDGYVGNSDDCYDGNQKAYPGQSSFFEKDRGDGSFDYDCNGMAEKEFPHTGNCVGTGPIEDPTAKQGWDGHVPAPGKRGKWLRDCDRVGTLRPPFFKINKETYEKIQKGR